MSAGVRTPVCVFAKPVRAGSVKTRLVPAVGVEGAAQLAHAFVQDTWAALGSVAWARPILASTGDGSGAPDVDAREIWRQGRGTLGERLGRILRRALREAPMAMAIGSDSPGLPLALLDAARAALFSADAILGPCEDGGFYLIGLRRCPAGLLRGLPWSEAETFDRTLARLRDRGLETTVLAPWFDVDRPGDFVRLRALIESGAISAPATARALGLVS